MKLFSGRLQQPVENGSMSSSPIMVRPVISIDLWSFSDFSLIEPIMITHIAKVNLKAQYMPITFTIISFCSMFRQKKVQLKALRALHRRTSQEEHQEIVDHLKCVDLDIIWSWNNHIIYFIRSSQVDNLKCADKLNIWSLIMQSLIRSSLPLQRQTWHNVWWGSTSEVNVW